MRIAIFFKRNIWQRRDAWFVRKTLFSLVCWFINYLTDEKTVSVSSFAIHILRKSGENLIRYKWKPTGVGIIDNLGVQFAKIVKGANQGSIQTRYRYAEAGERFIKFVAKEFKLKKLQNVQDKHVEAYARHLKNQGKADKYIKNELSGIRFCHRQVPQARFDLMDGRQANQNYGLSSTPDGRADRAWTDREVDAVRLKVIELEKPQIKRIIEASRNTGMRLDEAASLKRHEVEDALRTGILHLTNTKGGRPRDLPLTDKVKWILQKALSETTRGNYVFTPEGQKVHEFKKEVQSFIYNHRDLIQDTDRNATGHNLSPDERGGLTFHGLRHSFAREQYETRLNEKIESGVTEDLAQEKARQEVSELLGHGRDEVTFIYT